MASRPSVVRARGRSVLTSAPPERQQSLLGAVTVRGPVGVVLALGAADPLEVGGHHLGHDLEPAGHEREHALARGACDLGERHLHVLGEGLQIQVIFGDDPRATTL